MPSVTTPNITKLNQLDRHLPNGLVADGAYLEARGYSSSLRTQYVKAGWLQQPVRGIYSRPHISIDWPLAILSMQILMGRPVIVGGRTALELQGRAHYVSDRVRDVHLYTTTSVPTWLAKLDLGVVFRTHNSTRLFADDPIRRALTEAAVDLRTRTVRSMDSLRGGLTTYPLGHWEWPLVISTLERAYLEMLDELPDHESFHQADVLMEGLSDLSPRRLQKLLEDCISIKVKRLFLFFADRHDHAWLKRLDRTRIGLGSGKRQLVSGGRYVAAYQITVPETF